MALFLLVAASGAGQASDHDIELRPGISTEIFVAPGHVTTLLFHCEQKVAAISLASPVLSYKYDKSLNQIEVAPSVRAPGAETNMNLRIGRNVYVLQIHIVDDVRAQFECAFTLADDPAAQDEARLSLARPLKPEEVDIFGEVKTVERAATDPVFRRSRPNLRIDPLNRAYVWNGCLIALDQLAQFVDSDTILFRVRWMNRTTEALYLDPTQYGLSVAGRGIPVAARCKIGSSPYINPGRVETVYLAVQGYRLSRHNDWELRLPPDAAEVGRLLGR